MSEPGNLSDEPILDSKVKCNIGEPSQDEIEDHRSKLSMIAGLSVNNDIATLSTSQFPQGIASGPSAHRHRRRRKRIGTNSTREESSKAFPTNPSEHVMFLLGECDGDDEQTHQLFCELDELWNDPSGSGETEWREAARWIKFEEDVEENGERWSKPHVATLPLFSVFELRSCLASGVIMLNLESYSMEQIADLVLNLLISEDRLPLDQRDLLFDVLLRRHVHLHERLRPKLIGRSATNLPLIRSLADIGKRHSAKDVEKAGEAPYTSLAKMPTLTGMDSLDPATAAHITAHAQAQPSGPSEVMSGSLQGKYDLHFLKKIAPGSETSNILVGETTFLTTQITVFIRLKEAVLLGDLTEVPVPTRFLFIHLGTIGNAAKYREIGRSMGVLMSDEVFHDVAYKARSRTDLLAGLDEFLSAATVLPPGEWDPSIRIEPPASVPSQDSRKTTVSNGPQSTVIPPQITTSEPGVAVVEQLHVGGDKLASLCLAAVGNATPRSQQVDGVTKPIGQSDSIHKSKTDLARSTGSRLELTNIESGGGSDDHGGGGGGGGHGDDPALNRTGRIFGGLVQDIKRRAPHYVSDFTDAIHVQCCASFIFLYFACLTPIITFGGLLAQATGGYLGTIESILSGAVVGITYSLFSGQPLTIMGSTGPVLVFESIIFRLCTKMDWSYLSFRLWIGIWVAVALFIMVALDLSALVKFITRFTEESFAALIGLIFLIEALKKTYAISKKYKVDLSWSPDLIDKHHCACFPSENQTDFERLSTMYETHPLTHIPLVGFNSTFEPESVQDLMEKQIDWEAISRGRYSWKSQEYQDLCVQLNGTWIGKSCRPFYVPDVFFFSCILFIATFVLAFTMKSMRNSLFFPTRVRQLISDFSVVIAIAIGTTTDFLMNLHTPKLLVPTTFEPTLGYSKRGWFIHPFDNNPWWTSIVAIGPSFLAVILIFMDQQITAVIVNRREHKLKKGAGYHLDLLVVAITILSNSILGIPWFVAATVLSINHVLSLKKESETNAPGERPVYLGCREQRITGVLIFLFIGLSVFMTPLLSRIPMPVLYGIFLFMGISSMRGIQMFERLSLLFMPVKYQPDYPYLRHVSLRRVHLFTIIQVACLVMLWVIKSIEVLAILFPIMVLAMCFIRKGLDFIFTQEELKWLDQILPSTKRKPFPRSLVTSVPSNNDFNKNTKFSSSANLLQEKKISQSEEKRINITEEMSKTSIWRQLSGADINNECKKTSNKSKDTKPSSGSSAKTRHRKAKHFSSTSPCEDDEDETLRTETNHLSYNSTTTTTPGNNSNNNNNSDANDQHDQSTSNSPSVAFPTKQQQPVLFCIDPKDTVNNTKGQTINVKEDRNTDSLPLLDTPKIMINPPSNQGSPETAHRRQQHHVQRI
ncbi:unnamed protein product [Schistosoma intercalatum]|nr:unnamed protein product [Schistosoma intercalatum]CAH8602500.1 unnamed protein product [Schistosoma intercalatum]